MRWPFNQLWFWPLLWIVLASPIIAAHFFPNTSVTGYLFDAALITSIAFWVTLTVAVFVQCKREGRPAFTPALAVLFFGPLGLLLWRLDHAREKSRQKPN
jgi:hypothetical protein